MVGVTGEDEALHGFVREHQRVLSGALEEVEMSEAMRERLNSSHYVFSGMKTFHELKEAFPELTREDGSRKGFREFLEDVRKVDETYNKAWLRAEYNFAHRSAQMAARWEASEKHGDRYLLQYRTQSDSKVRPEHAALHGVTLEKTDGFWDYYLPPNGWGCRCTVVEVLRDQYAKTPHDEAMDLGVEATRNDRRNMFRWNSGKKGRTFPDYNPYTISRCRDCDVNSGKGKLAFVPEYELCRGCRIIRECYKGREKGNRENLTRYTPEEKHEIYMRPVEGQFERLSDDKSPYTVTRHILKDKKEMDYKRVEDVALSFGKTHDVRIMPEIHASETQIRRAFGLPEKKNPDLIVGTDFVDVKSPFSTSNIVTNANDAVRQGSIACITDHLTVIQESNIKHYAKKIFGAAHYTKDTVYFYVNKKLYKITTADL